MPPAVARTTTERRLHVQPPGLAGFAADAGQAEGSPIGCDVKHASSPHFTHECALSLAKRHRAACKANSIFWCEIRAWPGRRRR